MALDDHPERDPDGVPHDIVFRDALAACLIALLGVVALKDLGAVGGVAVAIIAIPTIIFALQRRSEHEREEEDDELGDDH